jgi:DNA-binding NtrC family response regulator
MPIARGARFLVVDPDPVSRAQLRARLRAMHPKWEIFVARSAAQATALLERLDVDVVVSELCAERFDGELLLAQIAERWPAVVRVAHTVRPGVCRHAHRQLAKPAEDTALFVAAKTALRLRAELERHQTKTTGVRRVLRFGA